MAGPRYTQPLGATLVNVGGVAGAAVAMLLVSPLAGVLVATPFLFFGEAWLRLGIALGVAVVAAGWVLYSVRVRLHLAGSLAFADDHLVLGPAWWPVRVPYDRVTSIALLQSRELEPDELDPLAALAPPRDPVDAVSISGPGLEKRLHLGAQARACAAALAERCPLAVRIDERGVATPATGTWTTHQRDAAAAFHRRTARLHGSIGAFIAILGVGMVVVSPYTDKTLGFLWESVVTFCTITLLAWGSALRARRRVAALDRVPLPGPPSGDPSR